VDAVAHLLPEDRVGKVTAIARISGGLSGAAVYAVSTTRGELILRVVSAAADPNQWPEQLRVLRRVAEHGVAPALVHIDPTARATVTVRVAGAPLAAALADPQQREAVISGIVAQLRTLHALDSYGIAERDPIAYVRSHYETQRARAGFPSWIPSLDPLIDDAASVLARDLRRVLSHNDVNPGNVLWDGERAWLVDWDAAGLSHPFYDVAALAMFLQLSDDDAHALLALQEQRSIDDTELAAFACLRRLSAVMCGLVLLGLVPDLGPLPNTPPTLSEFYAGLMSGQHDLQQPHGRGLFALALLRTAVDSSN
jgi:thiamine kinase-like enzyme